MLNAAVRKPSAFGPGSHPIDNGARQGSGLFSLFDSAQISQFRETFTLLDSDHDGLISASDLSSILNSLGETAPSAGKGALSVNSFDLPKEGVNFTVFLSMMASHLSALDPEQDILEAFESFDDTDSGFVDIAEMRAFLSERADRMSESELDVFFSGKTQGKWDYKKWLALLRISKEEEPPVALPASEEARRRQ